MALYHVRLKDKDGSLISILQLAQTPRYTRALSSSTDWAFSLPLSDPKVADIDIAHQVDIYRLDDERTPTWKIGGRIARRNVHTNPAGVVGYSRERELQKLVTPQRYGLVYEGQDLASVVADLLKGWHTIRYNTQTDLEGEQVAAETSNVDTTTEPGIVILSKDGTAYESSGSITLRFDGGTSFQHWDRIRWMSDNKDPVSTTMQYRHGDSVAVVDGAVFSAAVTGADPEGAGVAISAITDRYVDVKINLATDDTESEDENGDEVGVTPRLFSVEVIQRTEGPIAEGTIPGSTDVTVHDADMDRRNVLDILRELCERYGYEYWVNEDGELDFAIGADPDPDYPEEGGLGTDQSNLVVFRKGRNMDIEQLQQQDSGFFNVLDCYGAGDGINQVYVQVRDDDSVEKYGEYRETFENKDQETVATLEAAGQAHMNTQPTHETEDYVIPQETFVVRAVVPDDFPEFGIGDTVRVILPEAAVATTARIVEERRRQTQEGEKIELGLNARLPDLVRNVVEATRPPLRGLREVEIGVPSNLRVKEAFDTITLTWNGNGDRYQIDVSTNGGSSWKPLEKALTTERYVYGGIEDPSQDHTFRVRQRGSDVWSDWIESRAINALPATPAFSSVTSYIRALDIDQFAANTEADFDHYNYYANDAGSALDSGTASFGATSALQDSSQSWTEDEFVDDYILITGGTGAGQARKIVHNTSTTAYVFFEDEGHVFSTAPDDTSTYLIMPAESLRHETDDTSPLIKSLTNGTSYYVWVEAEDTSGNVSVATDWVLEAAGTARRVDVSNDALLGQDDHFYRSDPDPSFWSDSTSGGGTIDHDVGEHIQILNTSSTTGSAAILSGQYNLVGEDGLRSWRFRVEMSDDVSSDSSYGFNLQLVGGGWGGVYAGGPPSVTLRPNGAGGVVLSVSIGGSVVGSDSVTVDVTTFHDYEIQVDVVNTEVRLYVDGELESTIAKATSAELKPVFRVGNDSTTDDLTLELDYSFWGVVD